MEAGLGQKHLLGNDLSKEQNLDLSGLKQNVSTENCKACEFKIKENIFDHTVFVMIIMTKLDLS